MTRRATNRRWFVSLSLRSLLVAFAGSGVLMAWLVNHRRRAITERRRLAEELSDRYGGAASRFPELVEIARAHADAGTLATPQRPFQIPFVRRLLGDDIYYVVIIWTDAMSELCANEFAAAFPEALIWRLPHDPPAK